VTTLELFFDLVFVLTLTQLTSYLEQDFTVARTGRVLLLFGVLWWMYGGYAWLTNQTSPLHSPQRLSLLAAMASFMVVAVAVPHAFTDTGVIFGVGYLVVVVIHLVLFSQAGPLAGVTRLAPFNLAAAALVLSAGLIDGAAKYIAWIAALSLLIVTPHIGVASRFDVNAEHFVERHGLLMIVGLGESVVAIGAAVDTEQVTVSTVGVVVLATALPAALWWAYFAGGDQAAKRTLARAKRGERSLLAIHGYFYAHIPMLLGILVAAAGIHEAVVHPDEPLSIGAGSALAGGIALFFAGNLEFRRTLEAGPLPARAIIAAVALATIPIGTNVSAIAQLGLLIAVVAGVLTIEHILTP
jgi:low temperature requirement protein LtrA